MDSVTINSQEMIRFRLREHNHTLNKCTHEFLEEVVNIGDEGEVRTMSGSELIVKLLTATLHNHGPMYGQYMDHAFFRTILRCMLTGFVGQIDSLLVHMEEVQVAGYRLVESRMRRDTKF